MRVIAGEWGGLRLEAPKGEHARPTTDRVKESMFHLMGLSFEGTTGVDLFAGSGGLGIELLSRGATQVVFVDRNPRSTRAIRNNLSHCGAASYAEVVTAPWTEGWQRAVRAMPFIDWVFVDPPYQQRLWTPVLQHLASSGAMIRGGIVCEHPKVVELPTALEHFVVNKHRIYGDIAVTLYEDVRVGSVNAKEDQP